MTVRSGQSNGHGIPTEQVIGSSMMNHSTCDNASLKSAAANGWTVVSIKDGKDVFAPQSKKQDCSCNSVDYIWARIRDNTYDAEPIGIENQSETLEGE